MMFLMSMWIGMYNYEMEFETMKTNISWFVWRPLLMTASHSAFDFSKDYWTTKAKKIEEAIYDPEQSSIVCSQCQVRGHIVRTCAARTRNEASLPNDTYRTNTNFTIRAHLSSRTQWDRLLLRTVIYCHCRWNGKFEGLEIGIITTGQLRSVIKCFG